MKPTKSRVKMFGIILLLLLIFPYYRIIFNGGLTENPLSVFCLMWAPAVSGIVTSLYFDQSLKSLCLTVKKPIYLVAAYFLPLIGCILVYGFVWFAGLSGGVQLLELKEILFLSTVGVLLSCLSAAGEEIGWRGFLLSELLKGYSYIKTSFIISAVWLAFHLPLILFSDYSSGAPKIFVIMCFTISVTAITFTANWLCIKAQSVWPAIILHASHNLFVQAVFDVMTIKGGLSEYLTTEFGIGLAIFYAVIAMIVVKWYRNGCVQKNEFEDPHRRRF